MSFHNALRSVGLLGLALVIAAAPAGTPGSASAPVDGSASAYEKVMEKMSGEMEMPLTGRADHDFAKLMITHHQGAIDMARVQLEYGTDPQLKAKAQKVIDDQTREIDELRTWLRDHPIDVN